MPPAGCPLAAGPAPSGTGAPAGTGEDGAGVAAHRPGGPWPWPPGSWGGSSISCAPLVEAAARAQAANALTAVIDRAIAADLAERDVDYGDFVTIQRDASGAITAMTTDMAALNQLRAQLVAQIPSPHWRGWTPPRSASPLGSLVDSELVWARARSCRCGPCGGGRCRRNSAATSPRRG